MIKITRRNAKLYRFGNPQPNIVLQQFNKDVQPDLRKILHMFRDGDASFYLSSALFQDFGLGGIMPNFPPALLGLRGPELKEYGFLQEGDIVVASTRFGMDDEGRKQVNRSGLPFETVLFRHLRVFFKHLSRSAVILSSKVATQVLKPDENLAYRAVQFYVTNDATYMRKADTNDMDVLLQSQKISGHYKTVCYLVYIPKLVDPDLRNGPKFLNCFGMNGPATLLWAKFLATEGKELLEEVVHSEQPRLIVAEMELPDGTSWFLPPLLQELPPTPVSICLNLHLKLDFFPYELAG